MLQECWECKHGNTMEALCSLCPPPPPLLKCAKMVNLKCLS